MIGEVIVGGYADHRKGSAAILMVRDGVAELDRERCWRLIERLQECIREPPIPILPPTVLKEAKKK